MSWPQDPGAPDPPPPPGTRTPPPPPHPGNRPPDPNSAPARRPRPRRQPPGSGPAGSPPGLGAGAPGPRPLPGPRPTRSVDSAPVWSARSSTWSCSPSPAACSPPWSAATCSASACPRRSAGSSATACWARSSTGRTSPTSTPLAGQTIGNRLTGLRVVDVGNGGPVPWRRAVLRWVVSRVSGVVVGIGYLWMLWDPRRQTWHDMVASTLVVQERYYPARPGAFGQLPADRPARRPGVHLTHRAAHGGTHAPSMGASPKERR